MKTGQRNNKGFSLVELVVVIAIMAVLTGLISIGMGTVLGTKVTRCTKSMESVIQSVRVTTMGKNAVVLKIYKGTDGDYYARQDIVTKKTTTVNGGDDDEEITSTTEKIGDKSVYVAYAMNTASQNDYTELNGEITLEFDRSSGALKRTGTDKTYVKYIYIYNEKRTHVKRIELFQETGNIKVVDCMEVGEK